MSTAATYDAAYLTNPAKVRALAAWVLKSDNPNATAARRDMDTGVDSHPEKSTIRKVLGYLFSPSSDTPALVCAYIAETTTQ